MLTPSSGSSGPRDPEPELFEQLPLVPLVPVLNDLPVTVELEDVKPAGAYPTTSRGQERESPE